MVAAIGVRPGTEASGTHSHGGGGDDPSPEPDVRTEPSKPVKGTYRPNSDTIYAPSADAPAISMLGALGSATGDPYLELEFCPTLGGVPSPRPPARLFTEDCQVSPKSIYFEHQGKLKVRARYCESYGCRTCGPYKRERWFEETIELLSANSLMHLLEIPNGATPGTTQKYIARKNGKYRRLQTTDGRVWVFSSVPVPNGRAIHFQELRWFIAGSLQAAARPARGGSQSISKRRMKAAANENVEDALKFLGTSPLSPSTLRQRFGRRKGLRITSSGAPWRTGFDAAPDWAGVVEEAECQHTEESSLTIQDPPTGADQLVGASPTTSTRP